MTTSIDGPGVQSTSWKTKLKLKAGTERENNFSSWLFRSLQWQKVGESVHKLVCRDCWKCPIDFWQQETFQYLAPWPIPVNDLFRSLSLTLLTLNLSNLLLFQLFLHLTKLRWNRWKCSWRHIKHDFGTSHSGGGEETGRERNIDKLRVRRAKCRSAFSHSKSDETVGWCAEWAKLDFHPLLFSNLTLI